MKEPATQALVRPDGTLISEREIQRGLRLSITASSIGMVWATVLGIPLTLMLQNLGASGLLIGLATTIQQLAMIAQIPGSYFTESFTARKKVWGWLAIPHRALWFIPALLPFIIPNNWPLMARWIVVVVAVSSILGQAATPCWYSWMVELIPEHLSAHFWARRQSVVMAVYLVAAIGVGYILDAFPGSKTTSPLLGFAIVFAIGAACGVADIATHLGVPEPKPYPVKYGDSLWRRIFTPLNIADFRWLSFSMGAWSFAMGVAGSFGFIFLRREYNFTYVQITLVTIAGSLGAILAGFQSGYFIDRLGARTYTVVLLLIGPLLGFVWFFMVANTQVEFSLPLLGSVAISQPLLLNFIASVVAGALFSSVGLCQIRLLSTLSPMEGRTMAMAGHWTIVGVMAALGPLLGGEVMDWCDKHPVDWIMVTGAKFGFYHVLVLMLVAICWFLAAPLMLQVSRSKGDLPIGEALPRLWLGNPLRAVRNLYNMYAVTAVVSATERERAVRDLGSGRVTLAVSDLIDNLDDPAYDVREAAVSALSKIDSPEAINALVERLDSLDCDLDLPIVRALRTVGGQTVVEALLRQLAAADHEIQFEAARSLGMHQDQRAVEPLLDWLQRTSSTKVFQACAEALARLGEPRLVEPALEALARNPTRLLREGLLVALGDVLGAPEQFYIILAKERETPKSELDRLLGMLRDDEVLTVENAHQLYQLFEAGDTSGCIGIVSEISQTKRLHPSVQTVIDSLRHRAEKPDPAEILLIVYLLNQPPAQ